MSIEFPSNASGQTLRRLLESGDDFSKLRDVDFSVIFRKEADANSFVSEFSNRSDSISLEYVEELEDRLWDVTLTKNMSLSYASIVELENEINQISDRFDGCLDGWGCMQTS